MRKISDYIEKLKETLIESLKSVMCLVGIKLGGICFVGIEFVD